MFDFFKRLFSSDGTYFVHSFAELRDPEMDWRNTFEAVVSVDGGEQYPVRSDYGYEWYRADGTRLPGYVEDDLVRRSDGVKKFNKGEYARQVLFNDFADTAEESE